MLAPFGFATFFINISGSFLIGLLFVLTLERAALSEQWRIFLIMGFLGAYTTFSTFEIETYQLLRGKLFVYAALAPHVISLKKSVRLTVVNRRIIKRKSGTLKARR